MKKHFFKVIAAFTLCGMFAFSSCTDFETDINEINDRLDQLETGRIADLENQVSNLEDALSAASDAIEALQGFDIQALKDQLAALQAEVDGIDLSKYVTVEDFDALEQKLGDLEAVVDGIDLSGYASLDYVDGTFATKDYVEDLNTRLGALEGDFSKLGDRVSALEDLFDVDTVKISEILAKIDAAQKDASDALGQIKSLQDALGVYAKTGAIQDSLDLKMDIADFNDAFEKALQEALNNGGEVTGPIAEAINAAVSKLESLFAQRLTSISLIPTAYLNGVPAIAFNSYEYYIKTVTSTDKTESVKAASSKTNIAAEAVDVAYHISPSYITKEDIGTPSYLIQEAQMITKASADLGLNVINWAIDKDILTVTVRRQSGISLNHDKADYIYTAALKVPIAEKNLIDGESEANVYSEYSALYEDVVTPYIAAVIDESVDQKDYDCDESINHFYATYEDAQKSDVAISAAYNESIDLLSMVTGCEGNPEDPTAVHREITKATLSANGLEFRFALPAKPFELGSNNTDQQKFAYLDEDAEGNPILKSTYVNAPEGAEPNEASIEKTPVVRVELVNVEDDEIVDVRYFKIQWTRTLEVPDSQDLGVIYTFRDILGCDEFNGNINWATFVEKILAKVNGGSGLSYNEFVSIYRTDKATVELSYKPTVGHSNVFVINWESAADGERDEYAAAFNWNILPSEYGSLIDGKSASELNEGDVLKTFTAKIKMPSNDGFNGTLTFAVEVDVVVPKLPSMHGFTQMNWDEFGELARIYPVQYKSTNQTEPTAVYAYNLNTLFNVNADGLFVDNILTDNQGLAGAWACRKWDLQFSKNQTLPYVPGFAANVSYADDANTGGYSLLDKLIKASTIDPNDGDGNSYVNWFNAPVEDFELSLENNESGIALLNQNRVKADAIADAASGDLKTVTLDVWGRINPYNAVKVHTFDVWFVNPLTIEAQLEDSFVDLVIGGSDVDATKAFENKVTDYAGYTVAVYAGSTGLPEELRVYYGLAENPVWKVDEALISLVEDGNNLVIDNTLDINSEVDRKKMQVLNSMSVKKSLSVSPDQKTLTFTNEFGWAVTGDVNIYVPAEITHKWGVETIWVKIVLHPSKVTGNALR